MTAHAGRVMRVQGHSGGLFQASCSCGWRSHWGSAAWGSTVADALYLHLFYGDLS